MRFLDRIVGRVSLMAHGDCHISPSPMTETGRLDVSAGLLDIEGPCERNEVE